MLCVSRKQEGGLCRGLLSSRLVSLLNSDDGGKQFKNNLEEIEMKDQIKDYILASDGCDITGGRGLRLRQALK